MTGRTVLGLALGLALAMPAHADTRRFALVAGANDGGPGRVPLRYAVTDAEAFASVLEDLGGVGRADQTVLVEPNRAVFAAAIRDLASTVGDAEARGLRTEVVVYYSGHSDETGLQLGETTYPYVELKQDLEAIGADVQVVVLDSCASGALVRSKGGVMRGGFLEDASNDVEGTAYLMSATADEAAQESDAIGGSFFTHYLVSGLRGGADHTQDGRVTLHEAYDFAKAETLRRTERTSIGAQHATHSTKLGGHGDFVFTDLSETASSVVFDPSLSGRLYVRDTRGRLRAELSAPGDRAVELALAPGTYSVVREDGPSRSEAAVVLGDAEHVQLTPSDFLAFSGEQVVARGGTGDAVAPPVPVSEMPQVPRGPQAPEPPPAGDGLQKGFPVILVAEHTGLQLGLVGADARELHGLQFGTLFTRVGGGTGLTASLGATIATDFHGAQAALVLNTAGGASAGWQGAMFLNVASDAYVGVQTALVNVGDDLRGVQVGLVNRAREAKGLQVGLVNSGGDGNGLQVGLVNVARDYDGASIGLVTVHRKGYNHLFATGSTLEPVGVGATWGSRYVYTGLQLGMRFKGEGAQSALLAVGGHLPVGRPLPDPEDPDASSERGVFVDADVGAGHRFGDDPERDLFGGPLLRGRVLPGIALGNRFAVQTGVVLESGIGSTNGEVGLGAPSVGWMVAIRL